MSRRTASSLAFAGSVMEMAAGLTVRALDVGIDGFRRSVLVMVKPDGSYEVPPHRDDYAGLVLSLVLIYITERQTARAEEDVRRVLLVQGDIVDLSAPENLQ